MADQKLAGRKALVIGANGMIGQAISRRLAAQGCDLALADIADPAEFAATLEAAGKRLAFTCDISRISTIPGLAAEVTAGLGGLDILVNAAGVTSFGSATSISEAEWDRVHGINLKGVFFATQAFLPALTQSSAGRIISIGSVLAKNGGNPRPWIDPSEQTNAGNAAYGSAKAGLHALTLYLARELASAGVTVNAVAPGPVASGMTENFPETLRQLIPLGRLGRPEDVAGAVAYLASDEAGFVTGEIIDVNGGLWAD